jgi:DNA-binding beta-propeller fold protein YncE
MTAEFEAGGILDRKPLPFQLEAEAASARTLSFPGKLLADPAGNRLFVSDSGHNRILIVTPLDAAHDRGETPHVIVGTGEPGADDGPIATASFSNPQGLALDGDTLYVADAGNHTIRAVNLRERLVTTIAGTGEQALYRHKGGLPLANPLNSPYDLAVRDGMLYIAMAGFHQLWAIDLAASSIAPFAGDGREDIVDGPRLEARLAQPYGLALSGDALYFADSETSAVRAVRPVALNEKTVPGPSAPPASVTTLIGAGLFDFGDRDGAGSEARLQHCQGVAAGDGRVFIADTYNHKVKSLDIASQQVTTLAGTGRAGKRDGPAAGATFNEPAGLSYADGRVYIADTNNHAVRVLNLASMTVSTLGL